MGYYTEFALKIVCDVDEVLLITDKNDVNVPSLDIIKEFLNNDDFSYSGCFEFDEETKSFQSTDTLKWYDNETDMRKLSLRVPDVLLQLTGHGEEEDDKWIKYFLNGKMQMCGALISITYDPFDASKLE